VCVHGAITKASRSISSRGDDSAAPLARLQDFDLGMYLPDDLLVKDRPDDLRTPSKARIAHPRFAIALRERHSRWRYPGTSKPAADQVPARAPKL
jgi:hypothetical protein